MKTINKLTMALVLGLTLSALLATSNTNLARPKANKTVTASPEKTIATYFKFPKVLIPYLGTKSNEPLKVEVIFVTGKEGKVTYAYAKTRDLKLKAEIEKQFFCFNLSQVKENVAHSVVLNFRYLETAY